MTRLFRVRYVLLCVSSWVKMVHLYHKNTIKILIEICSWNAHTKESSYNDAIEIEAESAQMLNDWRESYFVHFTRENVIRQTKITVNSKCRVWGPLTQQQACRPAPNFCFATRRTMIKSSYAITKPGKEFMVSVAWGELHFNVTYCLLFLCLISFICCSSLLASSCFSWARSHNVWAL